MCRTEYKIEKLKSVAVLRNPLTGIQSCTYLKDRLSNIKEKFCLTSVVLSN